MSVGRENEKQEVILKDNEKHSDVNQENICLHVAFC